MKAIVDQSGCIGCGICMDTCPDVFRFTDDGLAEVYADLTPEHLEAAKLAAADCPTEVITIEE